MLLVLSARIVWIEMIIFAQLLVLDDEAAREPRSPPFPNPFHVSERPPALVNKFFNVKLKLL